MRAIYLERIDNRIDTPHPAVLRTRLRWNPRRLVRNLLTAGAVVACGVWWAVYVGVPWVTGAGW